MSEHKLILREMTEEDRARERARIREIAMHDRASALEAAYNEGYAESYAIGIAEGRAEAVKRLMSVMHWSATEAMNAVGIPAEEHEQYLLMLN